MHVLCVQSVVQDVLTPERLVMEHVMLLTILHANVGTEVGALPYLPPYMRTVPYLPYYSFE